jgi:hypothetical protein
VTLTRFDVRDVPDLDLKSLGFRGDPSVARGDNKNLIAIVNMPARVASLAEVHDAAVEIRRLSWLNNGLAGTMYEAGISIRWFGRARSRKHWDILQRNDLHDILSHIFGWPAVRRDPNGRP